MNQLQHRAEFAAVLAQYQISEVAKQQLANTKLVLLVGPSSSGRNTIITELVKTGNYHYIVSDTTRQPRENNGVMEQNGREYWFRTEAELLADLQNGAFLEAAIIHDQQVSGISMRELQTAAQEGRVAINEIEVVGAANIHAAKPDALFLFILPPSFDEWMARMSSRGSLPADEVQRRLASAIDELTAALESDYYTFVVNDTFMHAAQVINEYVKGGHFAHEQSQARSVAVELLAQTKRHLAL